MEGEWINELLQKLFLFAFKAVWWLFEYIIIPLIRRYPKQSLTIMGVTGLIITISMMINRPTANPSVASTLASQPQPAAQQQSAAEVPKATDTPIPEPSQTPVPARLANPAPVGQRWRSLSCPPNSSAVDNNLSFVYPSDEQTLDYKGDWDFKVIGPGDAVSYQWTAMQHGRVLWQDTGCSEDSLGEAVPEHRRFTTGDMAVWVRPALPEGRWGAAIGITVHLRGGPTRIAIDTVQQMQHVSHIPSRHTAKSPVAPTGITSRPAATTLYVNAAGDGLIGVYVRVRPRMASKVILRINNNATVRSVSKLKDAAGATWDRVTYHGTTGYVRARFLTRVKPPAFFTRYVDAAAQGFTGVNLRARPSLQAAIECLIPNGARLRVAEVVGGVDGLNWSRATYKSMTGYVHSYLISPQRPRPQIALYVDAVASGFTGVNLHTQPNAQAPLETVIPNGARIQAAQVVVGGDNQNWAKVTYHGMVGYAHSALLEPQKPSAIITLRVNAASQGYSGANLRARPSLQAPVQVLIPNGARVRVARVVGDGNQNWSEVTYNGMTGYARSTLLGR
jgi:uncharacterized protein YraI